MAKLAYPEALLRGGARPALFVPVAELAYAPDLGSGTERFAGSNPAGDIKEKCGMGKPVGVRISLRPQNFSAKNFVFEYLIKFKSEERFLLSGLRFFRKSKNRAGQRIFVYSEL
jgi:hypothetical protein